MAKINGLRSVGCLVAIYQYLVWDSWYVVLGLIRRAQLGLSRPFFELIIAMAWINEVHLYTCCTCCHRFGLYRSVPGPWIYIQEIQELVGSINCKTIRIDDPSRQSTKSSVQKHIETGFAPETYSQAPAWVSPRPRSSVDSEKGYERAGIHKNKHYWCQKEEKSETSFPV